MESQILGIEPSRLAIEPSRLAIELCHRAIEAGALEFFARYGLVITVALYKLEHCAALNTALVNTALFD